MNRQQFIEVIQEPDLLNDQTLEQIRVVLEEYPFFQAGRLLWVKNLHKLDHIRYNNELKLAAAHIPDRTRLFELIQSVTKLPNAEVSVVEPTHEIDKSLPASGKENFSDEPIAVDKPDEPEIGIDYFSVNDVYETSSGSILDFSDKSWNNKTGDSSPVLQSDPENIILPSADFLGYESDVPSEYQLPNQDEDVDLDESRSFSEWLNVLRHQPLAKSTDTSEPIDEEVPKDKKMALIDSFLQQGERRRIKVFEEEVEKKPVKDFSLKSLQESEDLMTETLANIYIHQKHFLKAIDIFKQLSLKYPEKNIYFARRIKELEEQINNQ